MKKNIFVSVVVMFLLVGFSFLNSGPMGFVHAQDNQAEPAQPASADLAAPTAAPPVPLVLYPDSAQELSQVPEVVQAISTASSEIMLATDVLRSQEIAEALRVAITTRGVAVYILTPEENVEDPNSYLYSLALAGANVRLGPVEGSFLTLDRQAVLVGLLVTGVMGVAGYEDKDLTILVPDETYTASYVESFYTSFQLAPALDPATLVQTAADQVIEGQTIEGQTIEGQATGEATNGGQQ
jgi:hypothetical protein